MYLIKKVKRGNQVHCKKIKSGTSKELTETISPLWKNSLVDFKLNENIHYEIWSLPPKLCEWTERI